jgi:hypothetical protein
LGGGGRLGAWNKRTLEKDISKRLMIISRYTNTTTVLRGDCLIEDGISVIATSSARWRVWQ